MTCAVVQKNLEPPTTEQLRNAFRGIPGLTPADAYIIGNEAYGILVNGFERQAAEALKAALAAQGVETEVVEEEQLPKLPLMRTVHRLDCTSDALMIFDPLGRSFPLKWENILLIAAGRVRLTEFNTVTRTAPMLFGHTARSGAPIQIKTETMEQSADHWLLEIVISGAALRYSIVADRPESLLFQYLGARRTGDVTSNFKLVVEDIVKAAPQATINRGAYYLRENAATPFYYPSRHAFDEEMTWLLWSAGRPGEGATA